MQIREFFRISLDFIWLYLKTLHYNASIGTTHDKEKMQYTLLRENHVIEKGMSMKNTKKGFGIQKVTQLLERLQIYFKKYGSSTDDFLYYPLSTIRKYIAYTHETCDADISRIEGLYESIVSKMKVFPFKPAGVIYTKSEDIMKEARGDYRQLLYSRHSIRYFQDAPTADLLNEALTLASRTPSACNRQGWKTYIFKGEKCTDLLRWQGGARGFEADIPCCIIVTANLKAFLSGEVFQAYIDGGLYAQNLINAIHFTGLGCIPLSCGFHSRKLSRLIDFGIPENEVPIVIIGCGTLPQEVKVAISSRMNIEKTNKYC